MTYDLSTVWRIKKNERIDLGAVQGKFVSRVPPTWTTTMNDNGNDNRNGNELRHDVGGVVSVRKGIDGGFGFTIYPGPGPSNSNTNSNTNSNSNTNKAAKELDEDNLVIGRVIQGQEIIARLNQMPVVQSSGFGYKGLVSGGADASSNRSAPSRACRYGSKELYCNEFKPLKKILISNTGLVKD